MRAAVFRASGDLRIEDAPAPDAPGTGEVTLEVSHAAVCGTDSAEWDHGPVLTVPPVILGHEFAGRVVAVGSGVAGIRVGDRAASGAGISCAECEWCRAGRTNLCSSYHTLGLQVDGGLAELVNAPVSTLLPIPDGVTDAEGALAQPLAVAIHAVKRSGVAPGQRCVVIGVGGIGAFIVAAAASRGVDDVIAVDVDNHRLRTAALLGASQTVDASHGDLADVIRTNTGPDGPDVVIEASGAPSAPAAALASVRRGGRVMLVGLQSAPRELDLLALTVREIELGSTLAHVLVDDLGDSLEVLRTTDIFDIVVEKLIPLDKLVDEAIRPLAERRATGKVVVDLSL